jgi:membrane-associated protein
MGRLIYGLLFAIIFCETGLVIMPFLPGDSLLFAVGALSAQGFMRIELIIPLLMGAAIIGDNSELLDRPQGRRLDRKPALVQA